MFKKLRAIFSPTPDAPSASQTLQDRFPQYNIGKGSYASDLKVLSWGEGASLSIGHYCSIADGVAIFLGGEHRIDWVTTFPFNVLWREGGGISGHPKTKGDVVIGSDVWLGRECLISSGVSIGHGAVVGARAVVTKNVPPYAIVAGNPATIVRYRFDGCVVDALLKIEWWNWSDEKIKINIPLLLSDDVVEFIDKHSVVEGGA